jgi:hypothetical protein
MSKKKITSASTASDMIQAKYFAHRPENNNLTAITESWSTVLVKDYGYNGNFIRTGRYYEVPEPPEPLFGALEPTNYRFKALEKAYVDAVVEKGKLESKYRDQRPQMFAAMYEACSLDLRDHLARDASWDALIEAGNDPLAFWKLIKKMMSTSVVHDVFRAQKTAWENYNAHRQVDRQSLAKFFEERRARINALTDLGVVEQEPRKLALDFIDGLDARRYGELQKYLAQGVKPMPQTLRSAYDLAAEFVVLTSKSPGEASYAADNKKGKGEKYRGKDRTSRGSGRPAATKDTQCYACLKMGHWASDCPSIKRGGSGDDETAQLADEVPDLVDSDDEDDGDEKAYVCYKPARVSARSIIERAYKAAGGSTGELHINNIGIDSMCSQNLFSNRKFVTDIKRCAPVTFAGVGGSEVVTEIGHHPSLDQCIFVPRIQRAIKSICFLSVCWSHPTSSGSPTIRRRVTF